MLGTRRKLALTVATLALAMTLGGAGQVSADPKGFCPPGLAKKGACGHIDYRYVRGDHVVDYRIVDYRRYALRRPRSGQIYIETGGSLYLLAEATQRVIEAINLVDAATD
ncbi:MAG: hypothetical protein Kilf2KO_44130 [Rhodospirillales bacterium]